MSDDTFRLTALDARRYDFGNALRGYDRTRVDQFRDQVAEELERLSRANQELEVKARNFHEQLRAFRERDKALNDALISAQQLRGEIRDQAQREAALIIREAQGEAERSLDTLRADIRRSEDELQQLWRNRRSYLAQLRGMMEREIADLDNADSAPPPTGVASRATDHPAASRREPGRDTPSTQARDTASAPLRETPSIQSREAPSVQSRETPPVPARDVPEAARERGNETENVTFRELSREGASATESEPVRDIPRELVREFTNDMAHGLRDSVRDTARPVQREATPQFRQPWASVARDNSKERGQNVAQDADTEPARLIAPASSAASSESASGDARFNGSGANDERTNGHANEPPNENVNERADGHMQERNTERLHGEERVNDHGSTRMRETPGPRLSLPTPSWLDVVEDE